MAREIRALVPHDLPALSAFLRQTFGNEGAPGFADVDMLRWKYLDSGPRWSGARSYVVVQDGAIVAHVGFTPGVLGTPDGQDVTTLCLIDWAAAADAPGVGTIVYTHAMKLARTAYLVRGAPITKTIVPRLGFREIAQAEMPSLWIRPVREFLRRPKNSRALLRLGHGVLDVTRRGWHRRPPMTARQVEAFDQRVDAVLEHRPPDRITFRRTRDALNHMLRTPGARTEAHLLFDGERVAGYFLLAFVQWEARIVDLAIDTDGIDAWRAAYRAAIAAAKREPEACRVRAMASVAVRREALRLEGFWVGQTEPVSLYDPRRVLPEVPVDVQYFESDSAFT